MKDKCIFCDNSVSKYPTKEHILLSCLGARLESKSVICSFCNNNLQDLVDSNFDEGTRHIRSMLGIKNYDKSGKAPKLKKISSRVGELDYEPCGKFKIKLKPFTLEITDNHDSAYRSFQVSIQGNNSIEYQNNLNHLMSHLEKRYGEEVSKKIQQSLPSTVNNRRIGINKVDLKAGIISKDIFRASAKMLIILWAHAVGNDEVNLNSYDDIKKCILGKDSSINSEVFIPNKTQLDKENPFKNVLYIESNSQGDVVGYFQLLGGVVYKVNLGSSIRYKNKMILLLSNPLTNKKEKIKRQSFRLNLEQYFSIDLSNDDLDSTELHDKVASFFNEYFFVMSMYSEINRIPIVIESIISDLEQDYPDIISKYRLSLSEVGQKLYVDQIKLRRFFLDSDQELKKQSVEWGIESFKEKALPSLVSKVEDKVVVSEVIIELMRRVSYYLLGLDYTISEPFKMP